MRSSPATDVAPAKKRGDKDPGVFDNLCASGEIKRYRYIETMSNPPKPALFEPA